MANQEKQHFVVVKSVNGDAEIHPLKQWLRENPQALPSGIGTESNNARKLRRALRGEGWTIKRQPNAIYTIQPTFADDGIDLDELIDEFVEIDDEIQDNLNTVADVTFSLERDLQAALRANIGQLESGLKVVDGGKELNTLAGRIDIFAEDEQGGLVVIELKSGKASPEVVAQVLAYMGTRMEVGGKPVRGIIVAGGFHERVVLAARAVPNLRLWQYTFQFKFEPVI